MSFIKLSAGLAALLCTVFLSAQGSRPEPTFEAYADARQVVLNSYFEVTFTLSNAQGTDFQPPPFDDFMVVAGPSQSMRTTIVNGEMSTQLGISFTLQPRRTGTFFIDPATIRVGGRRLRTQPLRVTVVQGRANQSSPSGEADVFLRAEVSTRRAYIGQEITLDYKLFTTADIESINPVEESEYQGFYAREVRRFDSRTLREVIRGRQYVSRVIKRVVLFPQQTGELTIDPYNLQLGVVVDDPNNNSRSFFYRRQSRRVPVASEPVTINVLPLPEPKPDDFTGAVGNFTLSSNLSRTVLTTDDALSLRVTVEGSGDLKRVQTPQLELPDAFELYDPKVIREDYQEFADRVRGEKEFEYLLVPQRPGQYTITPSFTYFDIERNDYRTITGEAYSVTVRRGSNPPGSAAGRVDTSAIMQEGLRLPHADVTAYREEKGFWGSAFFWALLLLPILSLLGVVAYKVVKSKRESIDPVLKRQQRARRQALQRLQTAEQHRQAGQPRAFYNEVERAMLGYVGDKLQIPRADMTKSNVRQRLAQLGVPDDLVDRFLSVIQTCEMALYAGKDNAADMEATYRTAIDVLSDTEDRLGKK